MSEATVLKLTPNQADHQHDRRMLWRNVAMAAAENEYTAATVCAMANAVLDAYDARFPNPIGEADYGAFFEEAQQQEAQP